MAESGIPYQLITSSGTINFNRYQDSTFIKLDSVEGLTGVVRGASQNRPGRHGQRVRNRLKGGMFPVLNGTFVHDGPDTQEAMRIALEQACHDMLDETGTLRWMPSNANGSWHYAKVQINEPGMQTQGDMLKTFQIPLISEKPFGLGDHHEVDTSAVSGGGGLSFPAGPFYPITYDVPTGGPALPNNTGTLESWATYRIYGPITNPAFENITTGGLVVFKTGVVIPAGAYVEIDTWEETVYYNGDSEQPYERYVDSTITEYTPLARGVNSVRLLGSNTTSATKARIIWDDAHA